MSVLQQSVPRAARITVWVVGGGVMGLMAAIQLASLVIPSGNGGQRKAPTG
jgi:hypothetical protein